MRSKSYLFLLLVLGLGILSGVVYSQFKFNYGLDVRGGVALTYQMMLRQDQRGQAEDIRGRVMKALERRAQGPLGVAEPAIYPKGEDQIVVELPGATNLEEAIKTIGTSAKIQFYWAKNVVTPVTRNRLYDVANDEGKGTDPSVSFRRAFGSATDEISFEKNRKEYANIILGWQLILEGEELAKAQMLPSGGGFIPGMVFSSSGAEKMEKWSRIHFNKREPIAAVLDGNVLSLAYVEQGTVLRDEAQITGTFDESYVRSLVGLLNAGALPVDLKLLSSEKVDPTIGTQALDKIVVAGIVSFAVTGIFMLAYYSFPGLVAMIALILYTLFTLTVLKVSNATFSLAAIAGFILSLGMAVDANILVFERFKEEVARGKNLHSAIDLGFRRALPAIFDSNACTILTSLVLAYLGTGPVKGFASTLIIGVIISLFTAITVTRSLLVFAVNSGIANNPKWYGTERNWFKKLEQRADTQPVQIVNKPKKWFWISAISILVCLPFVFMGGLKPNVEFRGGHELQFRLAGKPTTADAIRASLNTAGIDGANVKFGGEGAARVAMVTAPNEGPLQGKSPQEAQKIVGQAIGIDPDQFGGSSFIGPAIQAETIRNAIIGVIVSSLLITCFLALRFGFAVGGFVPGLRFGFSAIGALVHDVLFVIGLSAVVGFFMGWEISALFITSMLTVIGFSVHDTIVIFDRIRENIRHQQAGEDLAFLMNRSITQSFARSLNTSMTVIATLIILLIMGTTTPDLKLFCATMLAGILSGTYSSIYNASPILYLWDRAVERKKGFNETLLGKARSEAAKHRVVQTQTPVADPAAPASGRSYGQVRRRANEPNKKPGHIEIEDL